MDFSKQINIKNELMELISNIKKEVFKDIEEGTEFPTFYKEILNDLNKAEQSVKKGDYELGFDIIGNINIDMLDTIDDLDDIIGQTINNLKVFSKQLKEKGEPLPPEINGPIQKINTYITQKNKLS